MYDIASTAIITTVMSRQQTDGGKELISKSVITLLRNLGATFTGVSERKFKTLGERCLSMMLQFILPADFWWDAYETSNYLTNRLRVQGYITPLKALTKYRPDLSHLRIWGM